MSYQENLYVDHNAGFFSCCTICLELILDYFNQNKTCPKHVDTTKSFYWYKTQEELENNVDIRSKYFIEDNAKQIKYIKDVYTTNEDTEQQFTDFDKLNYQEIRPFIEKYFSPTYEINLIIEQMVRKYEIQYNNTCVLFYRGNDKAKEMTLPKYESLLEKGKELEKKYPSMQFLVQSDEAEFICAMRDAFSTDDRDSNTIIFQDEIRYIGRNAQTTVDHIFRDQNPTASKYFLAIMYIMSRCKYVVCGTGNCSMWITFFRGNCDNVIQV